MTYAGVEFVSYTKIKTENIRELADMENSRT
jgi:hypothetical protein